MPKFGARSLHTVEASEEYKRKLRAHHRHIRIVIICIVLVIIAAIVALKIYLDKKEYTEFETVSEIEREQGAFSEYLRFASGFIKYNFDGATYIDSGGNMIWNQPYELEEPVVNISTKYAAVNEKNGKKLYIMSDTKACTAIEVTKPIKRVSVSDNGVAAVLMEEEGVGHIVLYSDAGEILANGELYTKNIGYPMDLAISSDGRLLAVDMLSINGAKLATGIIFYNFGNVGRNEVDNIVGSYSYEGLMVPRILYMKDDYAVAFSTEEVIVFSGSQKPEEYARYPITGEAKSIFYDAEHFGFVFKDRVDVYSPSGGKIYSCEDDFDRCSVEFMDSTEIAVVGEDRIGIYDMSGIKRLQTQSNDGVVMVLPRFATHYLFVRSDRIQEVRLK